MAKIAIEDSYLSFLISPSLMMAKISSPLLFDSTIMGMVWKNVFRIVDWNQKIKNLFEALKGIAQNYQISIVIFDIQVDLIIDL